MSNPELKRGPGRPAGSKNKIPSDIKEMILKALSNAEGGGVGYLNRQREDNPKAFLQLLGRIIPQLTQISGDPSLPAIRISFEKPDDSPKD